MKRRPKGNAAQLPRGCAHPSCPGPEVCSEPTWCSSLGRDGAAGRESRHSLPAQVRTPLPAVPAGPELGRIAGAARERPLICPDHVTQSLGPTRAQLGREPSPGVRDRRGSRLRGLGAGCSGTPPPAGLSKPRARRRRGSAIPHVADAGLGRKPQTSPRQGASSAGCREGDAFCILRRLCTVKSEHRKLWLVPNVYIILNVYIIHCLVHLRIFSATLV